MAGDDIARAVAQSRNVAEVIIGAGVVSQAGALFGRQFGAGAACIIADDHTWAAAGQAVEAALVAVGITVRRHILPGSPRPKPSVELADQLQAVLGLDAATPVAVGSGVINDVVKHAAFGLNRPYLCVATAASMDGYTSAGAPLSDRGFKKTIQCRPARAVLGDLDIIAAAPRAMTGWGYGDLAGKVPAGGDWILADALGVEAIDDIAWPMVQGPLRGWLGAPARVAAGDRGAIAGLFSGLTMVGLAMEAHGSSRPASGADHQIAHLWEMDDLRQGAERVSHGACVAVGTVASLRLFDWLVAQDLTGLDVARLAARAATMDDKAAEIRAVFGAGFGAGEIAARAIEETAAKHLTPPALRDRLDRIRRIWPDLRGRLAAQLGPASDMVAALRLAGAPAEASDIGVDRDYLQRTVLAARFLRSRYTVLDFLDETGLLRSAVAATVPVAGTRVARGG